MKQSYISEEDRQSTNSLKQVEKKVSNKQEPSDGRCPYSDMTSSSSIGKLKRLQRLRSSLSTSSWFLFVCFLCFWINTGYICLFMLSEVSMDCHTLSKKFWNVIEAVQLCKDFHGYFSCRIWVSHRISDESILDKDKVLELGDVKAQLGNAECEAENYQVFRAVIAVVKVGNVDRLEEICVS